LKYVDRVIIFDEDSPRKLIEQIKPDLIVKSGVVIPEEVEGYKVQLFDHVNGYSTTNTINEISSNRR
jgi:D-beta-D-heptose 7-phosphate kinase/D-beta-D-heptose 1-phosphate adenosyltransferase